jgi:RNA polymerase sigma-70 factor, ECF subfamily
MSLPSPEADDQRDMARLAAGHDAALDALMSRHAERLFHYLVRLLQNETEASDLAQEAFVRVYQNCARFNPRHKFSTWLYTIATNLAHDLQRHHARHPNVSLDREAEDSHHSLSETLPERHPGPGETLEAAEQAEAVRQAVAALPEDLRLPLILATYEDKSHAEIAEILNCSAKSVEMKIYRARQQLRVSLQKSLRD